MYVLTPQFLAEIEELTQPEELRVSSSILTDPISPSSADSIPRSPGRVQRAGQLAWANLSLHEAEYVCPHLFLLL